MPELEPYYDSIDAMDEETLALWMDMAVRALVDITRCHPYRAKEKARDYLASLKNYPKE